MADPNFFANSFPLRLYAGPQPGRKGAPKSRQGCVRCKRSRVKCDEAKPACGRCTRSNSVCTYAYLTSIGLAGSANQAGRNVRALLPRRTDAAATVSHQSECHHVNVDGALSPFRHPLLPGKSHHVLFEFYSVGGSGTSQCWIDINEPLALSSVIVVASLHFVWKTGGIRDFEYTFLTHQGYLIYLVNQSLAAKQMKHASHLIRQITTLCLAEICLANPQAAAAHLDGTALLLEKQHQKAAWQASACPNLELANRYFLFAIKCLASYSSKLMQQTMSASLAAMEGNMASMHAMVNEFHEKEALRGALSVKLKALRLIPSFIKPLPDDKILYLIDAADIIKAIRVLTCRLDEVQGQSWHAKFEAAYAGSAAARILELYASMNVMSIESPPSEDSGPYITPYCGMFAAVTAYLYSVLRFWDPFRLSPRVHRQLSLLLERNLSALTQPMSTWNGKLVFWQCFIAGFDLHVRNPGSSSMLQYFVTLIRYRATSLGIASWHEAEESLDEIAWPRVPELNDAARSFWESTCSQAQ